MIDMLRGLAALIVLFHHCFTHYTRVFAEVARQHPDLYLLSRAISDANGPAVTLFFVVSGFSIRLSVQRLDLSKRDDVNEYLFKRLKRILPLYVGSLLFAAVLTLAAQVPLSRDALSLRTLVGNLMFLQTPASVPGNWFVPFADNGPLWSLSFEMFYYLMFPALCASIRGARGRLIAAWAISVAGLAFNQLLRNPFGQFTSNFITWYCGVELAELYLTERSSNSVVSFMLAWAVLVVPAIRHASATLSGIWVGLSLFLLGYAALVFARRLQAPRMVRRLIIAPLAFCGSFSYALYLFHFPIIAAFAYRYGDQAGSLGAAVLTSGLLAWITERLALRPSYRFLQRQYV